MTKRISLLAGIVSLLLWASTAMAHANVGGTINGPDMCDYPGVGGAGAIGPVVHYWCDFPLEENGSRWRCVYGGAMVDGTIGVSILMVSAGLTSPIGVLEGGCAFVCPNGGLSETPNPPGAWKNYLIPRPCKTLPAPPDAVPADGPPPLPPLPFGQQAPEPPKPPPPGALPPQPLFGSTPAETNPIPPNPLQPENGSKDD